MIPKRVNNPVGWTGITTGAAILIAGALGFADDPDMVSAITTILGALVGALGVKVRSQDPAT